MFFMFYFSFIIFSTANQKTEFNIFSYSFSLPLLPCAIQMERKSPISISVNEKLLSDFPP